MLARQIKKTLGESPAITEELRALFQRVSDTYAQADEDRALIERSLELSSQELSAINKDIEAKVQKRTEELHEEHTRFIASINSLNVGFVMCDANDEIIMMNPSMQYILSPDPAASPSSNERPVRTNWTINELDGTLQPGLKLKEALRNCREKAEPAEFKNVALNARILHMYLAPIVDASQSSAQRTLGAVVLIEDVTEQAVLERSKNEFFSIASHELRTPLTAIRGNADIIQRYFAPDIKNPDLMAIVEDVHESAIRLIGIVNDFLDVSALEQEKMRLEPTAFTLHSLVEEVSRDLKVICDAKGLSFVVDDSVQQAPEVFADESRIKQVIYNLVGNATKFTEKGSITLRAQTDKNTVHVSVSDTGRGMSPEDQRLLFHKFQQAGSSLLTRDTPKGTGLGLYISKLIIERSGGTIALDHSEVGKGSTFVFSLPRANAAQDMPKS